MANKKKWNEKQLEAQAKKVFFDKDKSLDFMYATEDGNFFYPSSYGAAASHAGNGKVHVIYKDEKKKNETKTSEEATVEAVKAQKETATANLKPEIDDAEKAAKAATAKIYPAETALKKAKDALTKAQDVFAKAKEGQKSKAREAINKAQGDVAQAQAGLTGARVNAKAASQVVDSLNEALKRLS